MPEHLDDPGPRGPKGPSGLIEPVGAVGLKHPPLRFHVLGMAHLPTKREISPCAYTQKIVNLCRMLKAHGHAVFLYGVEGSDVQCDEFVPVVSKAVWHFQFKDYDWKQVQFDTGEGRGLAWESLRTNAAIEIIKRKRKDDFLLCPQGVWHKPVADLVGEGLRVVESGIGYSGVFAPFKVFESYAWMHYIYGILGQGNGQMYDAVIPNYYDPEDFPYVPPEKKKDYCLFIGRLIKRKGLEIAVEATKRTGDKLIVAGQRTNEDVSHWLKHHHVQYVGTVTGDARAKLMGEAKCMFVPTYYLEPFGGVAVEAACCGTPVLATDWGVFPETVRHGVTGWRCSTLEEFVWATEHCGDINPLDCHNWAVQNYSLERVGKMYEHYFRRLDALKDGGWYASNEGRDELDWKRVYA
jgi:glycosyltransferase involved in cell wall biosynthesis